MTVGNSFMTNRLVTVIYFDESNGIDKRIIPQKNTCIGLRLIRSPELTLCVHISFEEK